MNNEITQKTDLQIRIDEIGESTWNALKDSVYPGAKDASVLMVIDYCKALKIDPMLKPVHIVPMNVKNPITGKYEWRDVIMPGIGLYRIQASRSETYAGVSEPEFGSDITENLNGVKVTYPKYCKITVRRLLQGHIVEFTSCEYWIENYATMGRDSQAPNAMWKKRPYAQLAKCAEAQALRKAFPEIITAQVTAEEMEGKEFYENMQDITPKSTGSRVDQLKAKLSADLGKTNNAEPVKTVTETNDNVTDSEPKNPSETEDVRDDLNDKIQKVLQLIDKHKISNDTINKWLDKAKVTSFFALDQDKVDGILKFINDKYE
jgi:phage recombination protein Bet